MEVLNGPGAIGVNRLNSGSTSTGYRKEPANPSSSAAAPAQANHQRGERRAASTTTSSTSEVATHDTASDRAGPARRRDRKSTRLNSSHSSISYAVLCLQKKTAPALALP